jgi:hypothetical protein
MRAEENGTVLHLRHNACPPRFATPVILL